MASAVEEVRVTERDMTRAHGHQALDVAQNDIVLHDLDAPVGARARAQGGAPAGPGRSSFAHAVISLFAASCSGSAS